MSLKNAEIILELPYSSFVSVNSCYKRNNPRYGLKIEAEEWLWHLKNACLKDIGDRHPSIGQVIVDIWVFCPNRRGRKLDATNIIKPVFDTVAAALGVDDVTFGGTAYPTERSDNPRIVIRVQWQYGTPNKTGPRPDSKLYFGLVKPPIEGACVGYGSVFCTICEECPVDYCPEEFDPSVFVDNPCKLCEVKDGCPCMTNTEDRTKRIDMWWKSRVRSVKFDRERDK